MTLLFDDGRPPVIADYPVAAQSRFTIDVAGGTRRRPIRRSVP